MSVADHALHCVAYVALSTLPPTRAYSVVLRVGALLPQRHSRDAARRAMTKLHLGTCLSRAITISARSPGSAVVIGVQPPGAFGAHAWVEVDGKPLRDTDPSGAEIARLRRD